MKYFNDKSDLFEDIDDDSNSIFADDPLDEVEDDQVTEDSIQLKSESDTSNAKMSIPDIALFYAFGATETSDVPTIQCGLSQLKYRNDKRATSNPPAREAYDDAKAITNEVKPALDKLEQAVKSALAKRGYKKV